MQLFCIGSVNTLNVSINVAYGEIKFIATVCQKVGGVTLGNFERSPSLSNVCKIAKI